VLTQRIELTIWRPKRYDD